MSKSQANHPPRSGKRKRRTTLSITKIREYPGLEKLSDRDATLAVNAIEKLSNLLFYMLRNHEIINHEGE
jgi:hypothetical protein